MHASTHCSHRFSVRALERCDLADVRTPDCFGTTHAVDSVEVPGSRDGKPSKRIGEVHGTRGSNAGTRGVMKAIRLTLARFRAFEKARTDGSTTRANAIDDLSG